MKKREAIKEIKYRLAIYELHALLERGAITDDEFKTIKRDLIDKFKPMIGGLDIEEQ